MRSGQWVAFALGGKAEIPGVGLLSELEIIQAILLGAHKPGGRYVGIYEKAGRDPVTGEATPALVVPVEKLTGANLDAAIKTPLGLKLISRIAFLAETVEGLVPVTSRDEIPTGRLPADPNWQPQA